MAMRSWHIGKATSSSSVWLQGGPETVFCLHVHIIPRIEVLRLKLHARDMEKPEVLAAVSGQRAWFEALLRRAPHHDEDWGHPGMSSALSQLV